MFIKPLVVAASFVLLFSPLLAVADTTKMCNATQQGKCGHFCQAHKGMKSCMIDLTTKSGTCACGDGTSHTKS